MEDHTRHTQCKARMLDERFADAHRSSEAAQSWVASADSPTADVALSSPTRCLATRSVIQPLELLNHPTARIYLALALVCWLMACATLSPFSEPPRVTLVSLKPLEVALFEQRFEIGLRFQNPNDKDMVVEGMSYDFALNGKDFANGVSAEGFTIPAYGETVMTVTVVSTLFNVYRQIRKLEKGADQTFTYELSGHLQLGEGIGRVPFKFEGDIDFSSFAKSV